MASRLDMCLALNSVQHWDADPIMDLKMVLYLMERVFIPAVFRLCNERVLCSDNFLAHLSNLYVERGIVIYVCTQVFDIIDRAYGLPTKCYGVFRISIFVSTSKNPHLFVERHVRSICLFR